MGFVCVNVRLWVSVRLRFWGLCDLCVVFVGSRLDPGRVPWERTLKSHSRFPWVDEDLGGPPREQMRVLLTRVGKRVSGTLTPFLLPRGGD